MNHDIMLLMINEFKECNPLLAKHIIDYYPSGQLEMTIKLDDDSKVIYDHLNKTIRPIRTDVDDISEQDWRNEFAIKLRRRMMIKGIGQKELAAITGISAQSLTKYMNGAVVPSGLVIDKISKALGCSPTEFMSYC